MEESQIKQIIEQQPLHGSALLDPRCKILLLVCIGFVSYFLAGEVVSLALMLVYGLFIAVGNGGKWALKMIVVYIIVAYLNALLRYVQVPVLSVIMSVFGVTLLKLIPIVMMGLWILRTTYMDDLMVALQRMRLPQAVTIPLVVMFRYIPTLRIEYRQIRSTMDIRGISDTLWKRVSHPLATIEYTATKIRYRTSTYLLYTARGRKMCFFCFIHSEKCEKMNCKTKKNVDTSNVHHHLSRIFRCILQRKP